MDVDAVDGQVQCPVYTYFRRRTTGGRASDPPAHRASDSRHPLVPARTVQCILKYRTDLRSPLSAPRRLERDTVLRSRKKGGRGPTAYSIQHIPNTAYCMVRSKMTIEHTSNALLPGTIRPPEGTPRPMSCPESECMRLRIPRWPAADASKSACTGRLRKDEGERGEEEAERRSQPARVAVMQCRYASDVVLGSGARESVCVCV